MRTGDSLPNVRIMRKNEFSHQKDGTTVVLLTQNVSTVLNTEDWVNLNQILWYAHKGSLGTFYACATKYPNGKQTRLAIHREIMRPQIGMVVDHINHNTLDNRKSNLRVCTPQQNQFNQQRKHTTRPGRKGVYFFKKTGKWDSQICLDGRNKHLGYFLTDIEAAQAYDNAAKTHFGEFACLNLPS